MSSEPPRGRITARQLLALILGLVAVLVVTLSFVTTRELRVADDRTEAETRRFESFKLADSLRQSSDDLTRMARLYVSTGEERYADHYEEIVSIRAGTSPRPRNWQGSYWDYVLDEGRRGVDYGPPVSLIQLMRRASFTPRELAVLGAARDASNTLTILERDVMRSVRRSIDRGADHRLNVAAVYPHYRRLVDRAYHRRKGRIARLIERVVALVDRRTSREIEALETRNERLLVAQIGLLGTTLAVLLAGFLLLVRRVSRPLAQLMRATRRIAGGDYGQRASVRGAAELERLAGDFNDMATAVQRDIAARERAQAEAAKAREAAEQASHAKSTFLATMSHEIRTPMFGVTGMLDVLARTELDPHQRRLVSVSQSSAASLLSLIGDILDFSKIEAGRLEIAPGAVSLRAITETAIAGFRALSSSKGLVLGATFDDRLAEAHRADPARVRQILNNFLSNAIKFTKSGGIDVTVRVLDDAAGVQLVELAVTDTGVGISEEQQRALFREFSQAEATTARRYGGTGLGLVICRRLAEAMGGEIALESEPGVGTTARLSLELPLADPGEIEDEEDAAGEVVLARPRPSVEQAEREGSLVLLADDHPVNRTVLTHQLEVIGLVAETTPDGRAALAAFKTGRFAIVLTDLNMPQMDGFELARAIRAFEEREGLSRTPLLAITATVLEGEREKCLAAGMDDFVPRPTTISLLAGKLRRWLPGLGWPSAEGDGGVPGARSAVGIAAGLGGLTGADPAVVREILGDYLDSSRTAAERLDEAIAARAAEEVFGQAHRIKGASAMVGAREVADAAGRLESAPDGAEPDWQLLRALLDELSGALERTARDLDPR